MFEGRTIENIAVAQRVGVDPAPAFNVTRLPPGLSFHAVESDTYFASITPDVTFDLAFLDGLHTFEQTWVDLLNALAHLPHGAILIDDTVPIDRFSAMPSRTAYDDYARSAGLTFRVWMGDVWKVVICINRHLPELNVRTIVGRGNRQTLVWRRSPDAVLSSVSPEQLRTIAALDYQEIMGQGLPAEFQPAREHEAIQACLETLQRAT